MSFSSYEELKAAAAQRRTDTLTLEVPIGTVYSQEYEDAKKELATAQGMKAMMGGTFLGDNIEELQARVDSLKPEIPSVWIRYKRLDLAEWAALTKQFNITPIEQYEKVVSKTFVALFGEDPDPEDKPEGWVEPEPLTTNAAAVSTRESDDNILPGPALHSVVQAFMAWQNSGGDVTIRPTRSGRV